MLRSEGEHFIEHSNVSIIIIIIATKTVSIVHGIQIQMIKFSYKYIIIMIRALIVADVRSVLYLLQCTYRN
jgi:hypothetical protein